MELLKYKNETILGIDHGYGFIKTANTMFSAGIKELVSAPFQTSDILTYDRKNYVVGQSRNIPMIDKTTNDEYYLMTLVAIAKELEFYGRRNIDNLVLSAGLPYAYFASQKKKFKQYLLSKPEVAFTFEGKKYRINIKDVVLHPQGLPILLKSNKGKGGLVSVIDIGTKTVDIITFNNNKPLYNKCFSLDDSATLDWIFSIKNNLLNRYQINVSDADIQNVMQKKNTTLSKKIVEEIQAQIAICVNDLLKEVNYMTSGGHKVICGGGATAVKNFANKSLLVNSKIETSIYANAKGFELLALSERK